jgi:hypothetical protein
MRTSLSNPSSTSKLDEPKKKPSNHTENIKRFGNPDFKRKEPIKPENIKSRRFGNPDLDSELFR